MAEMSVNEDVPLLAFSPLAAGILTGKYLGGKVPRGSRAQLSPGMGGRQAPREDPAARAYVELAAANGIDPVHMALAWHRTRPFTSIPIFGATTIVQLEHILAGVDVTLSKQLIAAIDDIHKEHPMPY
jgi:aryl-alcohol dehydrogenase-like predicted oxidoreductase